MQNKRTCLILYNDVSVDARVLNQINILKEYYAISVLCTGKAPAKPDNISSIDVEYIDESSVFSRFAFMSNTTNSLFNKMWSSKINTFLKRKKADLVHAHDLYMLPSAFEAANALSIPIIVDLHENYKAAFPTYSWTNRFPQKLFVNHDHWKYVEETFLPKVNGIIVLSRNFQDDLISTISGITAQIFAIYPNVPDLSFYKDQKIKKTIKDNVFRLFYLGVIGYSRGLHVASKAIQTLTSQGYKVELHIAGKVHKNDLEYFYNEVIGDHVIHIPWIHLDKLGDYLSDMDLGISPIFKNPQHDSGVANKVFQYMLFDKPVLVSDSLAQKNLVTSTGCGLVHQDQDYVDFAEKTLWFINNYEERQKMGKRGREAILEKYNTDTMGKELLKIYRSVI